MEQGAVLPEAEITSKLRPISEKEWRTGYGSLGLLAQLDAFIKTPEWKPCVDDEDDRLSIPVAGQHSFGSLVVAHRSLGIKVVIIDPPAVSRSEWRTIPAIHTRGVQQCPYQINIHRSFDADDDLRDQSAHGLWERKVLTCDIIEYLLTSFALHVRNDGEGRLDDGGTGTLCAGTRRGEFSPIASYCTLRKQLQIAWVNIRSLPLNFGAREVFQPA